MQYILKDLWRLEIELRLSCAKERLPLHVQRTDVVQASGTIQMETPLLILNGLRGALARTC